MDVGNNHNIRVSAGTHGSFFKRSLLLDTVVAEATQRLVTTVMVMVKVIEVLSMVTYLEGVS